MPTIEDVRNQLATYYFQTNPNPLVTGIAIGYLPQNVQGDAPQQEHGRTPQQPVRAPEILMFIDPSAATCELNAVDQELKQKAQNFTHCVLRVSQAVALHAAPSASISPYAPLRYNVPPVSAATFGARVEAGGQEYILSCNHGLAYNGRVPDGAPVLTPGPLDDPSGGSVIGFRSYFSPLRGASWSRVGAQANQVDCALARAATSGAVSGNTPVPTFSGALPAPIPVTKNGRTTQLTGSRLSILKFSGPVECTFGRFYFEDLMATYDGDQVFAEPGDSGALVVTNSGDGVGLVTAKAFQYDAFGKFLSTIILICSLDLIAQALATQMGLAKSDLKFFR